MAEQAEKVGGRINELRKERGWSRPELARRMPGVTSGNDIYRWEKGQHLPQSDTLDAIAALLEVSVADLYAGPMADREEPRHGDLGELDDSLARRLDQLEERISSSHAELLAALSALETRLAPQQRRQGRGKDARADSGS